MRCCYLPGLVAGVILLGLLPPAVAVEPAGEDEQVLKKAGLAVDGPGLLAFFRQRTRDAGSEARLKALVRQLGDDSFKVREQASRQLVAIGPRARPLLREAANDRDPEIARRAQECLKRIEEGATGTVVASAVRLLGQRRPPEAAGVLLAYLPSAEDKSVAETVRQTLATLAVRDGKPEPALLAALTDKDAVKRGGAGAALGRARLPQVLPAVRKLLQDSDAGVRLRVGLALASAGDKDALGLLVRQLDELPQQDMGLVLTLLDRLAGDTAPPVVAGPDEAPRRKARQAWEAWWKDHQARIEPAQIAQVSRTLGCTLVILLDVNTIQDLDPSNRVRWQITNLAKPLDVQLLPGEERVLIAEHGANHVTERNLKGEVVWEKKVEGPLTAQRLTNGNTFITSESRLLEVDKDGKEVFSYSRPDGSTFMRATKLRNGDIVCITQIGGPGGPSRGVRLTPNGKGFKEVKSWGVEVRTSGGRLDVLPNGHVLVPEMLNNRVVEYDTNGQIAGEVAIEQPIVAVRLPNGNTLVTLMQQRRAVELGPKGHEVWHYKSEESRVTRAYRR